jgi:hypothetical protein
LTRATERYFNFTYRRSGTLWEGRYRATVVDSERYLLTLMRYIELNLVRAGLVANPQDYPCSSYRRKDQRGADTICLCNQGIAKKLIICVSAKINLPIITVLDDILWLTGDNIARKAVDGDRPSETETSA